MFTVGSFEAKTHLAELLERAANGETIIITKHGKPLARLAPLEEGISSATISETISQILDFRRKRKMTSEEILDLIRQGRKH